MKDRAHGGDVFHASSVTGIPVGEIVDFSASINPLGMSGKAAAAAKNALGVVHHYPEPFAGRLAEKIVESFSARRSQIIPGNGSTELIYLLPRALKPETVLVHNPTFSEYERAALLAGAAIKTVAGTEAGLSGLWFDFARFAEAVRGAEMAFLCNPNNPTGELLEMGMVLELAREAKKARCFLVVDEAFIDFCPGFSLAEEAAKGKNPYLIVLRSMTKFHALTGLRAGYAIFGSARVASEVLRFKEPWSINTPAEEAAIAALDDAGHARESLLFMEKEKKFMARGLEKAGVCFFTKGANGANGGGPGPNFFFIRLPGAQKFIGRLFRKGVLVRDCSNFKGCEGGGVIRFAVKRRPENVLLLNEIKKWAGV